MKEREAKCQVTEIGNLNNTLYLYKEEKKEFLVIERTRTFAFTAQLGLSFYTAVFRSKE